MKTNNLPYQSHLFRVRLWQERIDGSRYEWRGQITCLTTGETRSFRTAIQLIAALGVLVRAKSWEGPFLPEE